MLVSVKQQALKGRNSSVVFANFLMSSYRDAATALKEVLGRDV